MKLNKKDINFYQNEYNIYVGDIKSEETVYLDDKFMIIGEISTKKGIVATEHFIIIGNIEAKSMYVDNDFLCVGEVNCTNIQNYGEYKVINKKFKPVVDTDEILKENNTLVNQLEKDYENIKVDDEYNMINIGYCIEHKKYGKGKVISRYDDIFTVKFEDGEKDMKGEWIIDSKFISQGI